MRQARGFRVSRIGGEQYRLINAFTGIDWYSWKQMKEIFLREQNSTCEFIAHANSMVSVVPKLFKSQMVSIELTSKKKLRITGYERKHYVK